MTQRQPCPPAPGPLVAFARQFDAAFTSVALRHAFRAYLHGLLLPRERNKTPTTLAGSEPVIGAQAPPAQRLQWFLSTARWEVTAIAARRLALLLADPATATTDAGVLIIDETGDSKDGQKTAHVARSSPVPAALGAARSSGFRHQPEAPAPRAASCRRRT